MTLTAGTLDYDDHRRLVRQLEVRDRGQSVVPLCVWKAANERYCLRVA